MANQNPIFNQDFVYSVPQLNQSTQEEEPIRIMLPTMVFDEQPILVNPQRYERIIKRRIARDKELKRPEEPVEKPYQHESRHNHACKRQRGPGGIFLAKDVVPEDNEPPPKKKVKYSRYSAACVLYGMPPDD